MVLDTRTLGSLHDLAAVVRDYTTPDRRSRVELTDEQKKDGCMIRYLHGWHVHHIVEALGIANANYSHNWEDNMIEALEECALSDYWNTQRIRLRPGAQSSKDGPNTYGAARRSALRNAIAEVLIGNPKVRSAATKDEEGKDIPGTSLMERASTIIDNQIERGLYHHSFVKPEEPGRQNINRYIRDMEALGFVWEGAGRTQIMDALPEETREAVDNEIRRQCRLQVAEGAIIVRGRKERAAPINYSAIARDIYSNFIINEQLQDTMETMTYPPILPGYVRQVCQDAKITVDVRRPFKDQIADEANIKLVADERKKDPTSTAWQIHRRTGLQLPIVHRILDNLGLPRAGRAYTTTEIRNKILAAHDNEQLTSDGMLAKYPELAEYFKNNVLGADEAIRGVLNRAGRTPITAITLQSEATEERRLPLIASQVKGDFLTYLRSRDEEWHQRVRGNLTRATAAGFSYVEETGFDINDLAATMPGGETPEFMRRVFALLEGDTPQLIAIRGDKIVIPRSALEWITMGGETVEGEVEGGGA